MSCAHSGHLARALPFPEIERREQAMVAILVLITIITCLTIDYFAEHAALRHAVRAGALPDHARLPQLISVLAPEDLAFVPAGAFVGPGHSWLELDPAGSVRVGVDRLPWSLLGGVEAIEALPVGTEVQHGEPLAVLRQGDRKIEVKSPVNGVITAANPLLATNPARIAKEPFGAGWLVSLKPKTLGASLRRLLVGEEARVYLRDQLANLRDFLVGLSMAGRESPAFATATLPDGGLPVEGLATRLTDEEWREMVERFF
jgi:glycine cleavage system H lipoate-binding protein